MSSDPNLNHEAVLFYRETFRLCPSSGRRKDIISTVTDLELWKEVLKEWKEQKWNPLKVNWMLSDYERRAAKHPQRSTDSIERTDQRTAETETVPLRVSEWRASNLQCMSENEGVRFRASSKTLEEIVTKALQQSYRSEAKIKP